MRWEREHGMNLIEHFCKQFDLPDMTSDDIDRLEEHFPKEKEFARLKWEWQFGQRHPKPKRSETYLFSAVPFHSSLSLQFEIDPKTLEVVSSEDKSVKQPRVASVEVPKIVERALLYEIKKILRACENTVKGDTKRELT